MFNPILWTASITPFSADGASVDFESFERLLRRQENAGNGILLLGSTGEGLLVSEQEREDIIEFAVKLKLTVPLMVSVPSVNLKQALATVEFCQGLPVSAFMFTTPIYTKPGIWGQTEWFNVLLEKAGNTPVMLYTIPSRTGVTLYPEVITNLRKSKNLWAIKNSTGRVESVTEYKAANPEIVVYCGDDCLMDDMELKGAVGLISVVSNAWENITRKYVDACNPASNNPNTLRIRQAFKTAAKAILSASNPLGIKALVHKMGYIAHPTVRLPLSLKDLPPIETLYKAHESIIREAALWH